MSEVTRGLSADGPDAPYGGVDDLLPYSPPPGRRDGGRHGRGAVAALVAGIVGLFAAGVFALTLATGDGGSSSPEDAVQGMLDAVAAEDVIGVLESLAPGERRALQGGIEDLADELRRLGVLDDSLDLRSLSGIDVEFEGVELASDRLADHLATVRVVAGTARTTTSPQELPLGPLVDDFLAEFPEDPRAVEPETTVDDMADDEAVIATVQEGGRWYVSLFYSIAEEGRTSADKPLPDFDAAVPAVGASSPEAAVEELARAAVALDVRRLVELTPPDEMQALHEYAPLFLADAEAQVAAFRAEGLELRLDRLDLSSDVSGDEAVVAVDAFAVSGAFDGEPVSASYDGECFVAEGEGERIESCVGDAGEQLDGLTLPPALLDLDMRLRTVQVDGQWYVSPTRSLLGSIVDVLRALERDDLESLVETVQQFVFGFAGLGGFQEYEQFEEYGSSIEHAPAVAPDLEQPPGAECFAIMDQQDPNASPEEFEARFEEFDRCMQKANAG